MKKYIFSSFLLFTILVVEAQSPKTTVSPLNAQVSTAFDASRLKRADEVIQSWVDKGWMNGGVGLILRDGKIEYYKAFGYSNMETKTAMKKDDIFRIASQTKAITSTAVLMLYEEGKFLLDEPISKFIPEFSNPKVLATFNELDSSYTTIPASREITIRDLLTHTSGIGYAQIGSKTANSIYAKNGVVGGIGVKGIKLADNIKRLGRLPLFHNPGEKFTYGLNTDVLGYLVEVVSGMTLDQFFRKRIFEPLGMKDTYFYLPENKKERLVMLYSQKEGKLYPMAEQYTLNGTFYRDFPKMDLEMYSGGGGLSSTIMDYAIFLQMILNGGEYNGVKLLSRNTVRMMTMNQIGNIDNGINKFGLGFGITTERGSAKLPTNEGTFDWGGMFASTYWVDPTEKLVGLFFRNVYPTQNGDINERFKVLTYQALK
jgi:CubicO group peptidase (beta-lactamase class C family)